VAKERTKPTEKKNQNGNCANIGFEAQLFLAADKLRGNLEPSDYKHVALGLIFLKYISDAFEAKHAALLVDDPASAEDPVNISQKMSSGFPKTAAGQIFRRMPNNRP